MPTLQLMLASIALLGFIACGIFALVAMSRRRSDVLNARRATDTLPFERSPEIAAEDGPTFEPMPALDPIRRRDDVAEALQRIQRRRRAA
jgi:hypothetical protein